MNIIILTKKKEDGEKLRSQLSYIDKFFSEVPCFTKKEIVENYSNANDCNYIFSTWYMPEFSEEEVKYLFPQLKAIFYAAGTVKYFANSFLKNNIRIFSAARANGIPVAEYVASSIILANKGFLQSQRAYHWPIWTWGFKKARLKADLKYGNYNARIGIIGCGAIGSKVIELLNQYKLEIVIYDPYVSDEKCLSLGVKKESLENLFATCDVITNHLPDIEETRGIINYKLLSSMKSTATFINTGRGRQVVEKDLAKVMRRNPDMCALLDVTCHEPMYPWNPLYFCKNVFLTPHIAGSLSNEFGRMVEYMVQAYKDTTSGIANPCEVSIEQLSHQA